MALQSQAPRSGSNRRYAATSRRSKKGLAPWMVLIGVAVILAGLYFLFVDPADPTRNANAAEPDSNQPPGQAEGPSAYAPTSTTAGDSHTPPPSLTRDNPGSASNPATSGADATVTAAKGSATAAKKTARPGYTGASATTATSGRQLKGEAKDQYELGMQRLEAGDIITGRALLSELLFRDGALPRHEATAVRERLAHLSEQTLFTRDKRPTEQIAKDPILAIHKVQPGEYLSTIANTYRTPYQLIERINATDARKLQAGQSLQVIKGPVHARIDKSDYRMDLYVFDPDGLPIYLKSYTVGLGEFDSTPIGTWRIKPGSKVGPANGGPSWRNPRTGKVYDRNDPDIPIGEYWMALEGTDEKTSGIEGYGIHATNDPASIGRQESMGCVRMRDQDVDQVFYTLYEGASTVQIVP